MGTSMQCVMRLPTQAIVDEFKRAVKALNFESGGIRLNKENLQLLETVLPPMVAFAELDDEARQKVLAMLGSRGRRHLEHALPAHTDAQGVAQPDQLFIPPQDELVDLDVGSYSLWSRRDEEINWFRWQGPGGEPIDPFQRGADPWALPLYPWVPENTVGLAIGLRFELKDEGDPGRGGAARGHQQEEAALRQGQAEGSSGAQG